MPLPTALFKGTTKLAEEALAELALHGLYWLPDPYANKVLDIVQALLPDHELVAQEPRPWDEWVIVDRTVTDVSEAGLETIAAKRLAAWERLP